MSDVDHRIQLSVRGEAQRDVAPDQVSIHWSVSTSGESKSSSMAALASLLGDVTAGLSELHGAVLTPDSARSPLTWSTQSMHTQREYAHDKVTGDHGPTGRHQATANSVVIVRDFALLERVEAMLTRQDTTDIHSVEWSVDHDNPAWAVVRADAIEAALRKGRDYASALRGALVSVDHIADAGLLGSETPILTAGAPRSRAFSGSAGGGEGGSMTPVPQVLTAVIEARLTALIAPLPAS